MRFGKWKPVESSATGTAERDSPGAAAFTDHQLRGWLLIVDGFM